MHPYIRQNLSSLVNGKSCKLYGRRYKRENVMYVLISNKNPLPYLNIKNMRMKIQE